MRALALATGVLAALTVLAMFPVGLTAIWTPSEDTAGRLGETVAVMFMAAVVLGLAAGQFWSEVKSRG